MHALCDLPQLNKLVILWDKAWCLTDEDRAELRTKEKALRSCVKAGAGRRRVALTFVDSQRNLVGDGGPF